MWTRTLYLIMFEAVDQKRTSDGMSGKSESTDGPNRVRKRQHKFWRTRISTIVFFVPIKSCCGEASLIGEDEACPIIVFCLIMYVFTCFSLVGILARNAPKLSLSNEPFLLKQKSCVFLCSWCASIFLIVSYLHKHTLYSRNHCTKNSSLCFQNHAWCHMFTRIFRNSKYKTETIVVIVQTNKFGKFK